MAKTSEVCEIIVPDNSVLWVADCPTYEQLPPTAENWLDVGCLDSYAQTTNKTFKDVKCAGKKGTQKRILQDVECSLAFGLKCLDPANMAFAAGGKWVPHPKDETKAILYPTKKNPPEKSLFMEFQNSECIFLPDGTEFQPTYGHYYPRASIDSSLDFDLGTPGATDEIVIAVTVTILNPAADEVLNPDACDKILFSDHPGALELANA